MARSSTDLPRMQNQSRARAPLERSLNIVSQVFEKAVKPKKPPTPRMMRQYDLIERVKRYNPNTSEAMLNRAYVYAMKAHGEQRRASGDPYFSHPLEVAGILTDLKLDDATIAAALLHDTIEDTTATRAEIDQMFGHDIGALVEGLTKLKKLDLVTKEAKQAENLRKLLLAIADDVRVLLVKLADRLHNMRTLSHMPPEARRRSAEETLDIYAPLAGRMGMHEMREELEDLAFRELNPEAHAVISGRLDALEAKNVGLVTEIEQQLTRRLSERGIAAEVSGRRKRAYSIWRKMERKSIGFEQLSDIFGFRVMVKSLAECYQALGIVHTTWPVVPGLNAQAERLSLHSHHGDRPEPAARRIANPHQGYARDRGIRNRRACALQGRRRFADGDAVARVQRLCVAAPHHRTARRGLQSGGVPRAHQARAVP
jgi:(p)ppGpp synthase/HD superfamily hydrolase